MSCGGAALMPCRIGLSISEVRPISIAADLPATVDPEPGTSSMMYRAKSQVPLALLGWIIRSGRLSPPALRS